MRALRTAAIRKEKEVPTADVRSCGIPRSRAFDKRTLRAAFGNDFKAGAYFIEVSQGDKIKTQRVIKF